MKIRYKRKIILINLIIAFIWVLYGLSNYYFHDQPRWINAGWILAPIYFISFYIKQTRQYISIESGMIKKNQLFGKKLQLSNIREIRHFAGEYILKSDDKKMTINLEIIEEASLCTLKSELKKLDVKCT